MKYSDFVENGATDTEKQEFLGAVTWPPSRLGFSENLRDSGKEAAALKSVSFSAFIRMCMIEELVKRD